MDDLGAHRPGTDAGVPSAPKQLAPVKSLLEHRVTKVVGEHVRIAVALKLLEDEHTGGSLLAWMQIQEARRKQEKARQALKEASAELDILIRETQR